MFFHHSIADNKLHYCMCSVVIIIYYFFSKITVWIIAHYAHLPLSFALTTNQPITLMILSTNYLISISPWMACAAMKLIVSLSAHNLKYVYQEKMMLRTKICSVILTFLPLTLTLSSIS